MYKEIMKKGVSLSIAVIFAISNTLWAAPVDIRTTIQRSYLRPSSLAVSSFAPVIAGELAKPLTGGIQKQVSLDEEIKKAQDEFQKARDALLLKAQELLDFLDGKSYRCNIGAPDFSKEEGYRPLILAVGSPSPEAFAEAAKQYKGFIEDWGIDIPVVTSTGRGRGAVPFIENTQRYYEAIPSVAKAFGELRAQKKDALTEAEVIKFIFENSGQVPSHLIFCEMESNNTLYNVEASYDLIIVEVMDRCGYKPDEPLKILVVADAFHRLRTLLTALKLVKHGEPNPSPNKGLKDNDNSKRKKLNWKVTAVPFYQPDLKDMSDEKLIGYGEEVLGYLEQWIGDPYSPAKDEHEKPLIHGEIGRYEGFGLIGYDDPGYKDLRDYIKSKWDDEALDGLRANLLKRYIEAKQRLDALTGEYNEVTTAKFATPAVMAARRFFRTGEKLWRKAKDSPDRSQVEKLAKEAINNEFKEAKKILDSLSIKDPNVKKLLELIEGDKPGGKGGRIGRAEKTIKESEEMVDVYNEDGTVKSGVKLPTCQYLHADPKGLIHATVGLFIFTPEGDIVFQKRAPNKVLFPGMLTLAACGHVSLGRSVFETLDEEVEGETGIQNISKKDITPIGDPEIVKKEPRIYDQRIDLIAYEFTATTQKEAKALRDISKEINEGQKKGSKSVFDRIISNYNEDIWTLTLYTFGWHNKEKIAEVAGEITQKTGVPIGDVNYNREVKVLYAHVAAEEDMENLKTKKTEHKDEEVAKFEIDTRSIKEIAKDFSENPEKYPDTFIPTFTDPVVKEQLADIQQKRRKAWLDALPGNLLFHGFSQKDVDNLYSSTLAAYMNLLAKEGKRIPGVLKDLVMQRYEEEQQKVLLADKDYVVGANNDKYNQDAEAVLFEGVTTVSNIPESHRLSILFRDIVRKIEDWQKKNLLTESKKPILATVAVGSEHITIFDLICQDEGAQKNGDWYKKYNDELNQKAKEEINKLTTQRTADKGLSAVEEKEIKKQVSYEVIAREVFKALKSFKAEKRPVFKPLGIAAFPPDYATSTKSVLILSMAPASAEDLAIVVKMQKAIEEATGISNSGIAPFKGHVTLGYFINNKGSEANPITPEDLNKFKEFVNSLDEMVRGESDNVRCFLKMPSIELSYFKNMNAFPSIATFSWTDKEYNESQEVDVLERIQQLQKSTMPGTTAAFSAITGAMSEDVGVANYDKYLKHMESRWEDFERVKSKDEEYKTRSEITQEGIQSSLLKFDANGNVLPFLGYSSVMMLPKSNPLYLRLAVLQEDLEDELEAEGLGGRIGYVTPESFHMTFCDLVVEGKGEQAGKIDLSAERKKELEDAFDRTFRNLKGFYSTEWEAKGIGTFGCSLLLVRMFPQNKDDLAMVEGARKTLLENSGKKHKSFIGHMTLGYIVKPFNEEEYAEFLKVLQKCRNEHFGTFMMDHVQLSHFTDMNNFPTVREVQLAQKPPTKASSAGTLNLDDIESLNTEALDTAIASAKGDLAKILVKSKFVGELFKVKAAGTIAIDDESLPANQRDIISNIYDENSEALKELERLTGCVIRLRSQLREGDIKGQLIIISDKKEIPGYENARYLNIKNNIPKATDSYLPLVPLIGIAKVLLTSDDIEHIRNTLNKDDFYRDIFGHPVTKQQIQNFLDTGIFELPVPKFDYEKVEQLQRQALAALIAA